MNVSNKSTDFNSAKVAVAATFQPTIVSNNKDFEEDLAHRVGLDSKPLSVKELLSNLSEVGEVPPLMVRSAAEIQLRSDAMNRFITSYDDDIFYLRRELKHTRMVMVVIFIATLLTGVDNLIGFENIGKLSTFISLPKPQTTLQVLGTHSKEIVPELIKPEGKTK